MPKKQKKMLQAMIALNAHISLLCDALVKVAEELEQTRRDK